MHPSRIRLANRHCLSVALKPVVITEVVVPISLMKIDRPIPDGKHKLTTHPHTQRQGDTEREPISCIVEWVLNVTGDNIIERHPSV